MASRDIAINVRVLGAANAARQLGTVTAELHRMGQQSRRSSDLVRNMGRSFSAMGNEMAQVARRSSYVVAAMGSAAVYAGIKFNATMESQTVAFKTFLGSKAQADTMVKELVRISTDTPFQLTDIIAGTRQLLAFGMSGKDAANTMELMGNAIASSAGGAEEVERASRALGQVQAAGVLHAQDLNQLVNAGVISMPLLAKTAGTTTAKYRKEMSLGKITSEEFFKAAREGWANDPMYKGAAEKQMRTFNGQVERLKDLFNQTAGAMTHGLFEVLRKRVLPAAGELMGVLKQIWDPDQPRTFGDRARESVLMIKAMWGPLWTDFKKAWEKNDMTAKLKEGFERFVAWFVPKAVQLGQDAASGMWEAWKNFDPKTKAFTAGVLLTRLGITKTVLASAAGIVWAGLKMLGGAVGGGGGKLGGGKGGAVMNVTAAVVNVYGGKGPKSTVDKAVDYAKKGGPLALLATRLGTTPAMLAGAGLSAASITGLITLLAVKEGHHDYPTKGLGGKQPSGSTGTVPPPGFGGGMPGALKTQTGGGQVTELVEALKPGARNAVSGAPSVVGVDLLRGAWAAARLEPGEAGYEGPRHTTVVNVQVDKKTIATAVHQAGVQKQAAR